MELGGGCECAATGEEDRLSALPDDILVLILRKLDTTRAAARTRVLSRRWRHVWSLLPELLLFKPPEPHQLRDALDAHNVLLRYLAVGASGATPESLAVWLPAAARRVSGLLMLTDFAPKEELKDYDKGDDEVAAQRGAFEFPCFDKATEIHFFLGYQGLAVPLTGVFARLTQLQLKRVWFHGPGELGKAVSSPRCPCLQRLTVEDAHGLRDLTIHSESMLCLRLTNLLTLSQLIVVAPRLKQLIIESCFVKGPPVTDVSAPLLTILEWDDKYDPSSAHLDKMAHLQWLRTPDFLVYGSGFPHNQSCLSLLQCFEAIESLFLTLAYLQDIEDYDYMMEDMAVLPDITFLCLTVIANGHAFGASALHVLRLCTGIRRLKLELESESQVVCSSEDECICLEQVEWETEELLLNRLEEVEICGCRGTEHEAAFVKRLFDWGIKLKEMTVNLCLSISEVKAMELYQTFHSFSRPGVCMKFYRYENFLKVWYAPQD